MEALLDELKPKKNLRITFTNISFVLSLLTLLQFCYLFFFVFATISAFDKKSTFENFLKYSFIFSFVLGSIFTLLAFIMEEKRKFLRWFSLIINLGMLLLLAFSIFLNLTKGG